jgi:hypothetical protein
MTAPASFHYEPSQYRGLTLERGDRGRITVTVTNGRGGSHAETAAIIIPRAVAREIAEFIEEGES